MAKLESTGAQPWFAGCTVQTLIGGEAVMNTVRDQLEAMITAAKASAQPPGARGLAYFTDWRMNGQRDLSEANPWGTSGWTSGQVAAPDQTVLGLLMRLLHAGVRVRVLLWMPVGNEHYGSGDAHIHDHVWIAAVIAAANRSALSMFSTAGTQVSGGNLGVVALDARVTESNGSHHQKTIVVRGGQDMLGSDGSPIAVAYVGGVDLTFTRRDAVGPHTTTSGVQFQDGDWQSGSSIPSAGATPPWPQESSAGDIDYTVLSSLPHLDKTQTSDLYTAVYGDSSSANLRQLWHDQHLMIRGPMVATIEGQFIDRWMDAGTFQALPGDGQNLSKGSKLSFGGVTISAASEMQDSTTLQALPDPVSIAPITGATSTLQMWRTIPARRRTTGSAYIGHPALFPTGEFTVLAGYAQAASSAQSLIWIFDQYFWSLPYARLLNHLVNDPSKPDLNVIVILPAHSDTDPGSPYSSEAQHRARREALNALVGTPASSRISAWNIWDRRTWRQMSGQSSGLGIYVHAKAHTYDGSLLVCGSANINKRSLTGDSEIAIAVLDPAVVAQHQRDRWQLLFPGQSWPNDANGQPINLDQQTTSGPGPGTAFHTAFKAAAGNPTSFLTPDQWTTVVATLPNGVQRDGQLNDIAYKQLLNRALESTSLPSNVEAPVAQPSGITMPATLADVNKRIASRMASQVGGG